MWMLVYKCIKSRPGQNYVHLNTIISKCLDICFSRHQWVKFCCSLWLQPMWCLECWLKSTQACIFSVDSFNPLDGYLHNDIRGSFHQQFGAWISNYIHRKLRDVIIHPCPNFNSNLAKPQLKWGYRWVISTHTKHNYFSMPTIIFPCPNLRLMA